MAVRTFGTGVCFVFYRFSSEAPIKEAIGEFSEGRPYIAMRLRRCGKRCSQFLFQAVWSMNRVFSFAGCAWWCHAMLKRRSSHAFMISQDGWPPLRWDPTLSPGGAFSRGGKHSDVGPVDGFCGMMRNVPFFFTSHKEFKNHSTSILAPAILIHFWLWGCDAWSSGGSSSGSRWCCMAHLCRWFSKILSAGPILKAPTCTAVASFTFIVTAICVSGEQVEVVSQTTEMDEFAIRG